MKIIRNTLKAVQGEWRDPECYPSNAGAGPLPPYKFLESVEGELVVELTPKELADCLILGWDEFVSAATDGIELPAGVLSVTWQVDSMHVDSIREWNHRNHTFWLTFSCTECEADPDWRGPEPPDCQKDE